MTVVAGAIIRFGGTTIARKVAEAAAVVTLGVAPHVAAAARTTPLGTLAREMPGLVAVVAHVTTPDAAIHFVRAVLGDVAKLAAVVALGVITKPAATASAAVGAVKLLVAYFAARVARLGLSSAGTFAREMPRLATLVALGAAATTAASTLRAFAGKMPRLATCVAAATTATSAGTTAATTARLRAVTGNVPGTAALVALTVRHDDVL